MTARSGREGRRRGTAGAGTAVDARVVSRGVGGQRAPGLLRGQEVGLKSAPPIAQLESYCDPDKEGFQWQEEGGRTGIQM